MNWSDTVRNATLDAWETAVGMSPKVRIYAGTPPADESASLGGAVLLAEYELASDWASAASGGTKSLSGLPVATTGLAAAGAGMLPTFYRFYAADGTTCHEQGLVARAWMGSTAYSVGHQVCIGQAIYRCTTAGTSASSGGPSGTGSGITDGTAVWEYAGSAPLVIDAASISEGQTVRITAWTKTAPH